MTSALRLLRERPLNVLLELLAVLSIFALGYGVLLLAPELEQIIRKWRSE